MTLDEATDRLYGVDLDDFGAERTRLAKELGAAGQTTDAAAFAKLRKPTTAAWVLNQLARRNRRDVDLLLDAGHRLRQAQAGVVRGGKRESFEQARQTEADALRRLGREAEKLLRSARGNASDAVSTAWNRPRSPATTTPQLAATSPCVGSTATYHAPRPVRKCSRSPSNRARTKAR